MANLTAKITSAYFNANDIIHQLVGEDEDVITTSGDTDTPWVP